MISIEGYTERAAPSKARLPYEEGNGERSALRVPMRYDPPTQSPVDDRRERDVMPVYEYRCPSCGEAFSKYHRSLDAGLVQCPRCGAAEVTRALSTFQMHQTTKTKLEQLDPKYERELEWVDRPHQADDPMKRINMDFTPPA